MMVAAAQTAAAAQLRDDGAEAGAERAGEQRARDGVARGEAVAVAVAAARAEPLCGTTSSEAWCRDWRCG